MQPTGEIKCVDVLCWHLSVEVQIINYCPPAYDTISGTLEGFLFKISEKPARRPSFQRECGNLVAILVASFWERGKKRKFRKKKERLPSLVWRLDFVLLVFILFGL